MFFLGRMTSQGDGAGTTTNNTGLSRCNTNPFVAALSDAQFEEIESRVVEWRQNALKVIRAKYARSRDRYFETRIPHAEVRPGNTHIEEIEHAYGLLFDANQMPCPLSTSLIGSGQWKVHMYFPNGTEKYVKNDGQYTLCGIEKLANPADGCVIYSLGSRNMFGLEDDLLNKTSCDIFTFDCTTDFNRPNTTRHKMFRSCVGDPVSNGPPMDAYTGLRSAFAHYSTLTSTLEHTAVDLLKIDIEGYEMEVISNWRPEMSLPHQILMELHAHETTDTFDAPALNK